MVGGRLPKEFPVSHLVFPVPGSELLFLSANLQGKSRHSDYNQPPKPDLDLPKHLSLRAKCYLSLHLPNHPPLPQSSMLMLNCINTYFLSLLSGKPFGDPTEGFASLTEWSLVSCLHSLDLQPDEITNQQIDRFLRLFFICHIQLLQACPCKCQETLSSLGLGEER